jgi:hypothetical protein
VRNDAQNPDLPRWIGGCAGRALSTPAASATAAASTAAADGELCGRIDGRRRRGLSASAATASASDPPFRRTRLIFNGRRNRAGRPLVASSASVRP